MANNAFKPVNLSVMLVASLVVGAASILAAGAQQPKPNVQKLPADFKSRSTPDQILVSTPVGTKPTDLADTLTQVNGTVVNTIDDGKMVVYIINVPKGTLTQNTLDKLGKDSHVKSVQVNMRSSTQ